MTRKCRPTVSKRQTVSAYRIGMQLIPLNVNRTKLMQGYKITTQKFMDVFSTYLMPYFVSGKYKDEMIVDTVDI